MPVILAPPALTEAVYYILLSLYTPMHGYAVMQNVAVMSLGRVALGAGTLYGALLSLREKGWIQTYGDDEGRQKKYLITDLGKTMVQAELKRLRELVRHGEEVAEDGGAVNQHQTGGSL
jgi:DNA-binding PadR family transcriptional regulator